MRLVRALDPAHRVTTVPFRKPGFPVSVDHTVAQCETAVWAILPDGPRWSTAAALNLTLATALSSGAPLWFSALPGVRRLQERAYRWVAANRGRFSGDTP